jgi:ubiquinone/menaquinone biosynthesis C-methylase UbiE
VQIGMDGYRDDDRLEEYFGEAYARWVLAEISPERTEKQVEFLIPHLPPPTRGPLLDVGCGLGRHALSLARRGWSVTGLDRNPRFVAQAQMEAERQGLSCRFQVADMRALSFEQEFAAVSFFWSSFGFYSDLENQSTLTGAFRASMPGGLLLLDMENRETILRHFQKETWRDRGDHWILERNRFDAATETLITRKVYLAGDSRQETERRLKLYSQAELLRMLAGAGFSLSRCWGDWEGQSYSLDSPRLLILASRPKNI